MKTKKLPLTLLAAFSVNAFAADNYTCITDNVSGFHHDPAMDSWEQTTFLPGERFRISESNEGTYEIQRLDDRRPWFAVCRARTDQTDDSFSCSNGTNEFHFNRKELRFTSFRYFGYWNGSTDSLSISIGKCFVD